MGSIVIICSIFYSSYNPFSVAVYRKTLQTTSETRCHEIAEKQFGGSANTYSYDLNDSVGKVRFLQVCGIDGKDCPLVK